MCFICAEYFDQWVCETACSVGENVISTRLFSTLCTHRLRKAFLSWRQATRVSQAATKTQRMCLRKYTTVCVAETQVIIFFSNRFFCKWQQKLEVRCTASNTLAHSSQVLVVRKWFDKWRACLHLRVMTKTADQHYNSLLLKKTYHFVTSGCCYTVCVFMCLRWFCCFSGVQETSSCKEIFCYSPTIIAYGLFCTLESCDVY